jgi:hypothetical protein
MSIKSGIGGRTLGFLAVSISVVNQATYWGATATESWGHVRGSAPHHWQYHSWSLVAMLIIGLLSVAIAIAGLIFDARRRLALIALFLALLNTAICAMPFLAV